MQHYFFKSMFVAAVFILTTNSASSQKISFQNIGVRAGANITNWHYNNKSDDDLSLKSRTNFEAALFTDIQLTEKIFIQPGLGLSSYGSKVADETDIIEYKLKYLTLPILAKYNLPAGVSVFAGPQIGILLSSKGELEGHEANVKNMFGKTDIMITGGVEYNFLNGFSIGARYNHGFANMYKKGNNIKLTNYSFGLSVAYKLDFDVINLKTRR